MNSLFVWNNTYIYAVFQQEDSFSYESDMISLKIPLGM